jgi:hypothetical protein
MSRATQKSSEALPQDKPSSRRELLTSALLGLGASVLVGAAAYAKTSSKKKPSSKKGLREGGRL